MNVNVNGLREQLRKELASIPVPLPQFEYRVGWFRTYEDLFRGEPTGSNNITDIKELVWRTLKHGRVMLHGRGGGGKSEVLWRLMRSKENSSFFPVWVDLKRWTSSTDREWIDLETPSQRLDFLLKRYAIPTVSTLLLGVLLSEFKILVFVDGLNELASTTAQQFIDSLSEIPGRLPGSGVIISDRLVRRYFGYPEDWLLSSLLPLEENEIKSILKKSGHVKPLEKDDNVLMSLLCIPYFLNAALQEGHALSETCFHEEYFSRHVSLTPGDKKEAARAAFNAYRLNQSRIFDLSQFSQDAGSGVLDKLKHAGAVHVEGSQAFFVHHLKHDYLVSLYLVADSTRWTPDIFDIVTFRAASFDVLKMTLELIKDLQEPDLLVRKIYDWNFYGAAYAVAESNRTGQASVSRTMEFILMSVLAERRWDIMSATVQRVTDALYLFDASRAAPFLQANSLEEIHKIVLEFKTDSTEFRGWAQVFTRSSLKGVGDDEISKIIIEDSLIGWAFANALKRLGISESQQAMLRKHASTQQASNTARWRVSHCLGSYPTHENAQFLLNTLDHDIYDWAKYGAMRSLMEMSALADKKLRDWIVKSLGERMVVISKNRGVLQEFERSIFIQKSRMPANWSELMTNLIKILSDNALSIEKRDHWQRLAYRVRKVYGRDK